MNSLARDLVWAIGICLVIAASPFLLDRLFARRRLRLLKQRAGALGFSFQDEADPFAGSDVRGLALLEEDAAALTVNVMRGKAGACETLVFERAHCNPGSPVPVQTTVAGFRCPSGRLPAFQIGERGWAHRLTDAVEGKFDLDLGPGCGGKLFVHCADAGRVRDLLPGDKLAQLHLEAEHFRVESSPDWILVFRPGKRVKPEGLGDFVSHAAAIATVLMEQAAPPKQQPVV